MSEHSEIPVGTRVICVAADFYKGLIGSVGVVVEGEQNRYWLHPESGAVGMWEKSYVVEYKSGRHIAKRKHIRPLPPEDDVTAYDRANRDVELEVC